MGIERITQLAQSIMSLEPRVDGTPLRSLGWVEVAAAMGKLKAEGADLLRALYLDDGAALRRTVRRLKVRLSGNGALSDGMREALAVVAVQAYAGERPCVMCGGHGHVWTPEREELAEDGSWVKHAAELVECDTCEGEGVDRVTLAAVRDLLGVGEDVFEILLAVPFLDCYAELRSWHAEASAKLARQIR